MIKGKYNEVGKCGNCGSEDIEYGDLNCEGEAIYYEYVCNKCEKEGQEWYETTYSETYIGEE